MDQTKPPQLASSLFGGDKFVIHFFEQGSIIDEFLAPGPVNKSKIIFTLSAETEEEVNEFADQVKNAGDTIVKQGEEMKPIIMVLLLLILMGTNLMWF